MEAKKIRFIINPFSGVGQKGDLPQILATYFRDSSHDWSLVETQGPDHGTELARAAAAEDCDLVVAIGGDGSVNEVMCGLVETKSALGVMPAGSGNGFGRHIGMSLDPVLALQQLMHGTSKRIDTCLLNDRPYLNLAGIGFDAQVATRLHQSKFRGFWAYLRFALEEAYRYGPVRYKITIDGRVIENEFLMIEIANAPMFGYNFEVASQARINDGWLEIVLVEAVPKWKVALSGWRMLAKSFHYAPFVKTYKGKKVTVESQHPMPVHVDGEGFHLDGKLEFSIIPDSLWLMVP